MRELPGPGGAPLTTGGAVSGINVTGGKAFVSIVGDPSQPQLWEAIRRAAEEAVGRVAGVDKAIVTLTAERAQQPGPAQPAHGHSHGHSHGPGPAAPRRGMIPAVEKIRFIIAVASGKGGVGKSTTAANLALGLAAQGWRVGLLDADVSVPRRRACSASKASRRSRAETIPHEAFGVKVMSIGFLVDEDVPMVWRGPMVSQALMQMLGEVAWGELDALVVDMPPGTGDVQLTLAQQVPLSGAVIVSTPQDLALIDARRAVGMFQRVEAPILGIIENMSYFLCPHCGGRTDVFSMEELATTRKSWACRFSGKCLSTPRSAKPRTPAVPSSALIRTVSMRRSISISLPR